MPVVKTRKEAARILEVDERTLANWPALDWWPADGTETGARGRRTNWDTDKIAAARDAAGRKGSDSAEESRRIRVARQQEGLKRDQIKTLREQMDLESAAGRLIPRAAEELFASTLLTELGDWCEQLPGLIANTLPKQYRAKLRERLKRELDDRRMELREQLEARARELDKLTGPAVPAGGERSDRRE